MRRKSVRIQIAFLRDLREIAELTFIDKDYNVADSGAKSLGGRRKYSQDSHMGALFPNWFRSS